MGKIYNVPQNSLTKKYLFILQIYMATHLGQKGMYNNNKNNNKDVKMLNSLVNER